MSRARATLDLHYRLAVFRRDGYTCQHCGIGGTVTTLHVDHVRPIALLGSDQFSNLQTLCERCNKRKGARFIG